jgi:AcrR family transcriptional regulator
MNSQTMDLTDWTQVIQHILQFEQEGLVTRTFRRLDVKRQQAIVAAILDEAVERGPTAINIKHVARRAGVSVGSLYQYFGNRDGLLDFAIELCVRYMTDLFDMSRPELLALPLRDGLAAYLTVGIEWSQMQVGLVQFFLRAAYQGDPDLADRVVRPIATAMRTIVRDMLVQAVERGEIRSDVDIEATARAINAALIATGDSQLLAYLNNYFQVTDRKVSAERVVKALLTLIMHGIGVE